ncbi:hypothetical protein L208DRAFT_1416112, partial [Tricholoma matsutake]
GWGVELQSKGKGHLFNHDHFFFSKLSLPVIDPISLTAGSLGTHVGLGSIEYCSGRKCSSQSCKPERVW